MLAHAGLSEMTPEGMRDLVLWLIVFHAFVPWIFHSHWNLLSVAASLCQLAIIWLSLRTIVRYLRRRDTPARFFMYCGGYVLLCFGTNMLIAFGISYLARLGGYHVRI